MEDLSQKLRLAFYDASDGPRIMVFGPMDSPFRALRDSFAWVSQDLGRTYELHAAPFVAAFGGIRVKLVCVGGLIQGPTGSWVGLRRSTESREPTFEWRKLKEGWEYMAELLDGLIDSSGAGHQYLTSYPSEDAIVVVSRGEYDDDVLRDQC